MLDGPAFDSSALRRQVRDFYEQTERWQLELQSQWSAWAWPFGWLISALFARRLDQLSLPLRAKDVADGMTSQLTSVVDRNGRLIGSSWRRRLRATGATTYSGWYQAVALPGTRQPSVRVVFPLPNGRLVVFLRPEVSTVGGLTLISPAGGWGDDGAYLVVERGSGSPVWARRIPVRESFHVYVDAQDVLRTDHVLGLWSVPALRLQYRLSAIDG
ncbi:hypothetical protein Raf01_98340 [Rugosimonospora africana]|uniref:Uncharacterized protein n=1 Tax=Rugosimonospora africana TaxID=556532 RepID=A0A8J3R557_9ACTN|nr:hypothetical protein Raf01_98340 [Rugosimonospora africana]